jgi:dihydroorotate dehydrogenase
VILIDGIPLDKLNRQQQLYVAIQAVTLAAGRMPLVICEAAELDDEHLREVAEACEAGGIQLVVARWTNKDPLRVIGLDEYLKQVAA